MKKIITQSFDIYYPDNDVIMSTHSSENKIYEPHVISFIQKYASLFNVNVILDIGANIGYHTLFFSKIAKKVIAFEPHPFNYSVLEHNISENNIHNVELFNFGCGDSNITAYMKKIEPTIPTNIGDSFVDTNSTDEETVNIVVLDTFLNITDEQIDVIKIDVQGFEINVLKGMQTLLSTHKPIIIIELEEHQQHKYNTTCKDIAKLLYLNNYSILLLEHFYPAEHICVHNERLPEFIHKFSNYIYKNTLNNIVNYNLDFGVDLKIKLNYKQLVI